MENQLKIVDTSDNNNNDSNCLVIKSDSSIMMENQLRIVDTSNNNDDSNCLVIKSDSNNNNNNNDTYFIILSLVFISILLYVIKIYIKNNKIKIISKNNNNNRASININQNKILSPSSYKRKDLKSKKKNHLFNFPSINDNIIEVDENKLDIDNNDNIDHTLGDDNNLDRDNINGYHNSLVVKIQSPTNHSLVSDSYESEENGWINPFKINPYEENGSIIKINPFKINPYNSRKLYHQHDMELVKVTWNGITLFVPESMAHEFESGYDDNNNNNNNNNEKLEINNTLIDKASKLLKTSFKFLIFKEQKTNVNTPNTCQKLVSNIKVKVKEVIKKENEDNEKLSENEQIETKKIEKNILERIENSLNNILDENNPLNLDMIVSIKREVESLSLQSEQIEKLYKLHTDTEKLLKSFESFKELNNKGNSFFLNSPKDFKSLQECIKDPLSDRLSMQGGSHIIIEMKDLEIKIKDEYKEIELNKEFAKKNEEEELKKSQIPQNVLNNIIDKISLPPHIMEEIQLIKKNIPKNSALKILEDFRKLITNFPPQDKTKSSDKQLFKQEDILLKFLVEIIDALDNDNVFKFATVIGGICSSKYVRSDINNPYFMILITKSCILLNPALLNNDSFKASNDNEEHQDNLYKNTEDLKSKRLLTIKLFSSLIANNNVFTTPVKLDDGWKWITSLGKLFSKIIRIKDNKNTLEINFLKECCHIIYEFNEICGNLMLTHFGKYYIDVLDAINKSIEHNPIIKTDKYAKIYDIQKFKKKLTFNIPFYYDIQEKTKLKIITSSNYFEGVRLHHIIDREKRENLRKLFNKKKTEKDEQLEKSDPYSYNDRKIVRFIEENKLFDENLNFFTLNLDQIFNTSLPPDIKVAELEPSFKNFEQVELKDFKKYNYQEIAVKVYSYLDDRFYNHFQNYKNVDELAQFTYISLRKYPDLKDFYKYEFFKNWNSTFEHGGVQINVSMLMMSLLSSIIIIDYNNSLFSINDAWNYLSETLNFWISLEDNDERLTIEYETNLEGNSKLTKDLYDLWVLIGIIGVNLNENFGNSFMSLCKVMSFKFLKRIKDEFPQRRSNVKDKKETLEKSIDNFIRKKSNEIIPFWKDN